MMTLPESTAVARPWLLMVATAVSALYQVIWPVMSCGLPKLKLAITSNACVEGGDRLRAMLGLVGVSAMPVMLAPPPVPITPLFFPQPQRATSAHVVMNRIKVNKMERLTISALLSRAGTRAHRRFFRRMERLRPRSLDLKFQPIENPSARSGLTEELRAA